MKKILALVLALVMTLSLASISSSAAFADDSSINYGEAVDVIAALGIVDGYANGNFGPAGSLTRGAGAKIICNILLGPDVAKALTCDVAPFSDVAADSTFAPYIAYCAEKGIINGYGDGTFGPSKTLSGFNFLKMLLCALGYDAESEGLNTSNYAINVALLATKRGLLTGNDAFVGGKAATREEAALYAYNALLSETVSYSGSRQVITIGDVKIEDKGTPSYDGNALLYAGNFPTLALDRTSTAAVGTNGLYAVTVDGDTDTLGRPAHSWFYKNEWVGTYAQEATYTAVATADTRAITVAELNTLYGLTGKAALTGSIGSVVANYDVTATGLKAGDVVEAFLAADGSVTKVVITRYDLASVKSVTALTAAQIQANASSADPAVVAATSSVVLTVGGVDLPAIYDTKIADFAYSAGSYVLVALNNAKTEGLASKAATIVSGTIDAVQGSLYRLNGTYYANAGATAALGVKGTWALNAAGALAADVDVTEYSSNYAYIYSIVKTSSVASTGLNAGDTYTVYGVDANGAAITYPVATTTASSKTYITGLTGAGKDLETLAANAGVNAQDMVVAYKINSDGKFEVAVADATVNAANSSNDVSKASAVVGSGLYATNATKFVFVDTATGLKVTTATGYQNVNIDASSTPYYAVTDTTSQAKVVFVKGSAGALDNSDANVVLAVKVAADPVETMNADGSSTFTYTFAVNGAPVQVAQAARITAVDSLSIGDVFTYTVDATGAVAASTTGIVDDTVDFVGDGFIQAGSTINLAGVAQYTITIAADGASASVASGATYSATASTDGNAIVIYSASSVVKAIFVVNVAAY